jgi:hypothetical protein
MRASGSVEPDPGNAHCFLARSARPPSSAMRTNLGVDAFIGEAQARYGLSADEVLLYNFCGVFRPDAAVPDRFGIDHDGGPMFALVETHRFVDPDLVAQSGGLGQLLHLGMQIALAISRAGRARRAGGTNVVANKDVILEWRQTKYSSASRLTAFPPPHYLVKKVSTINRVAPPASARMIA